MAVRIKVQLGVVAEPERLPDSADAILVVEPTTGSQARSKGSLYLLVSSRIGGPRVRELTAATAAAIRDAYYYDESAGVRVVMEKAISAANRRLAHHRDRLAGADDGGPIGVGMAVVRGSELYVATAGPAEAFLIRGARLSTLPDADRGHGLPREGLVPDVWRGEMSVGDQLVIASSNVVDRIGTDDLAGAMVTLHPQSAMDHIHHLFVAADGTGSDGALAIEATEIPVTTGGRVPIAARSAEPLAGIPDRSPIPLADEVSGGVATVTEGARSAGRAAGNVADRSIRRLQDLLPRRTPGYRRVGSTTARHETQRRAAVAILALVLVTGGLGLAVWFAGGARPPADVESLTTGQRALQQAEEDLATVFGPGVDLVANDPEEALQLLTVSLENLDAAEAAGIPSSTTARLRRQAEEGVDRIYKVIEVGASTAFSFAGAETPPDLADVVRGPDGAPFVLDRATKAVYRLDLKADKASAVIKAGQKASGTTVGEPKLMAVGGPDLLVLDHKNVLWRWRAANREGKGTLIRLKVNNAAALGDDLLALGTYCRNLPDCDLNNIYLVDPSEQMIWAYSPQADGGGYPGVADDWLKAPRDVVGVTDMTIDGDLFLADGGLVARFTSGTETDWQAKPPGDELLREPPTYRQIATGSDRREGSLYGFDAANDRVIALVKSDGAFIEQYRIGSSGPSFADLRAMYVRPGIEDGPATLWWIDGAALYETILEEGLARPGDSPSPSPAGSASPAGSVSPSGQVSPRPSP
ncbi:MAG TPA: hypothetical protein VJZ72_07695 [Candidatus Limnocylindrales bacterium]|nr:hypothetical protein [Candidatus Limnocylindrales bacterium]